MNLSIKMPEEVSYILDTLEIKGYEAFIVGGCVRDSLLEKAPKDWDITTNAKPEEVKNLFEKTIDTGIKHGTVTVVLNSQNFEITTYRIDGEYTDNRRPENVAFTSSLEEDLSRRDFTINALAYNPRKGLIDFFGGDTDIKGKVIRAVRDANQRFQEDALRMLRAIRFSAQLNFDIETSTFKAIRDNNKLIKNISQERIRDEVDKILTSQNPFKFEYLRETELLSYIMPEFDICYDTLQNHPYHLFNVAVHSLKGAAYIKNDRILRWTMLLHDIGKPKTKSTDEKGVDHFYGHPKVSKHLAEKVLKRLKFDNKTIITILRLIENHDKDIGISDSAIRKAINNIGQDIFPSLLQVKEADMKAQNPKYLDERLTKLNRIQDIFHDIMAQCQCVTLNQLAITGNDLIDIGIRQGKEMGALLNELLEAVIENPAFNNKPVLINIALEKTSRQKNNLK